MTVTTAPRIRRGALAALCTVAILTLPACGATGSDGKDGGKDAKDPDKSSSSKSNSGEKPEPFADLSGPEIAEKSFATVRAASSLTLKADVKEGTGTVVTDMALDKKGDCAGTMSMNGEGTATVSKVGATVYMKFDEEMLRAQGEGQPKEETDAVVKMLADRWVKTDAKAPDAKDFVGFCALDELLAEFEDGDSIARKGPLTTVDGQQAITLNETDGASDYTMYVATEGKPYLLKIVVKGKDAGTMAFTDFDKPVPAEVPADKDIVDLDGLGG
ncbi:MULTISPECIES: hypothetical protein [unclassified Streptomyces]|uniref:hypothetical protein n=1 Tax=unclassified Streptomyces TaxID=2593676 RepID=UPI00081DBF05|nr:MULTISPECIES: hypothetical protein [unclassified Streptomyces]SCG00227.1 hypothetical protein GA0115259_106893 [Streptomyces sp. MnatMP-M17]